MRETLCEFDRMPSNILPVAKSLYLCDGHLGFTSKKVDLMGVFESITPLYGYPHTHPSFVVFARLSQGLGTFPFRIDFLDASNRRYIGGSNVHHVACPNRDTLVNLAVTFTDTVFPKSGIYLIELYLDQQWVADTTLKLK